MGASIFVSSNAGEVDFCQYPSPHLYSLGELKHGGGQTALYTSTAHGTCGKLSLWISM